MAHTKNVAAGNTNSATPPNATTDGNLVVDANNTNPPGVQSGGANGASENPESESATQSPENANATLSELEDVIEASESKSYAAGKALREIRDKKLWKAAGYSGFEAYLADRWNMSRSHAYRLMDGNETGQQTCGDGPLPAGVTMSVLSVIAEIKEPTKKKSVEQRRRDCLEGLLKKATGGKVRVKDARKAVDKLLKKSANAGTSVEASTNNKSTPSSATAALAEKQELREKIDTLLARLREMENQLFNAGNPEGHAAFGELVGLVQQLRGLVVDELETEGTDPGEDAENETEEAA